MNSHPSKQQLMRLAIKARIMPSAEDAKQFLRSVLFRLWWRIAPDSGHCYYPYGLLGASRYTARDAGSCPANASEVVANQRDESLLPRQSQCLMLYMDVPCSFRSSFATSGVSQSISFAAEHKRVPHVPGFPVNVGEANVLHAAFREESRTRGCLSEPLAGNPGVSLLRRGFLHIPASHAFCATVRSFQAAAVCFLYIWISASSLRPRALCWQAAC
jgi:hypothetical protein